MEKGQQQAHTLSPLLGKLALLIIASNSPPSGRCVRHVPVQIEGLVGVRGLKRTLKWIVGLTLWFSLSLAQIEHKFN